MVKIRKDNLSAGANLLIEDLADLEHQQWSHMMKFFLGLDVKTIKKNVVRWNNLANTDYKDLSEKDKEKDRIWARKVLRTQWNSVNKELKRREEDVRN